MSHAGNAWVLRAWVGWAWLCGWRLVGGLVRAGGADREPYDEPRTGRVVENDNVTAVCLGHRAHDREAQAGSAVAAISGRVEPGEAPEHPVAVGRQDAGSVVRDGQDPGLPLPPERDSDAGGRI